MILSDLVKGDPDGFIDLDRNLARHIGADNVEAFHEEAGNLVVDELTDNPKLLSRLLRDDSVVMELASAIDRIPSRAFGRPSMGLDVDKTQFIKSVTQAAIGRDTSLHRDIVQGEILTNGIINDRTMRNPKIMEILTERVHELYKNYQSNAQAKSES